MMRAVEAHSCHPSFTDPPRLARVDQHRRTRNKLDCKGASGLDGKMRTLAFAVLPLLACASPGADPPSPPAIPKPSPANVPKPPAPTTEAPSPATLPSD